MLDACPHHHDEENAVEGVAPQPSHQGPHFWRSIDEWSGTPEFETMLHREFPHAASEWKDEPSRRAFLKVMGASAALVGLTGCFQKPREKIVPYVDPPEQVTPGIALFFATALSLNGYGRGALIRSNEGRPTKVEGNPDHPASLGASDAYMQAAVLQMYDPDRSQTVVHSGNVGSWDQFLLAMSPELDAMAAKNGEGLRILSGCFTSPSLAAQKKALLAKYPGAKWHHYDPISQENCKAGAKLAFGQDVSSIYSFDKAKIILSIDSDFLLTHPAAIRYAHDFIAARRIRINDNQTSMNRLYVIEGTPTITGAMADHRARIRPSLIENSVRQLLASVGNAGATTQPSGDVAFADLLAKDLIANRGASLIIAGESQPASVHALVHALNAALGNVGKTVIYTDPIGVTASDDGSLTALSADMQAGSVDTLVILNCNPVYDAPADLKFADGLGKVRQKIHTGLYEDETAFLCQWHLPGTHEFELWSDIRAYDGTVSIVQPLIAPLYAGKSVHQVINYLMGKRDQSDYELVRETCRSLAGFSSNFEVKWRTSLAKGVIDGTAAKAKTVTLAAGVTSGPTTASAAGSPGTIEVIFRPDPSIYDGTFSNNGWMQELPKPLTKLTWDNAVLLSPATASRLEVEDNKVVELAIGDRTVKGSVLILPDHPDDAATLHLGFGRTKAGRVGTGTGFNAYALRTTDIMWQGAGLEVRPQEDEYELAITQHHQNMAGRDLIKLYPIDDYLQESAHPEHKPIPLTLYPSPMNYDDPEGKGNHKWGMSIDNNACIGCNACVVACVAENNIAVVGREQVIKGREMHWLRIDAYYTGTTEAAEGPYFEPIPCMQCENAPCELVCPVEATVHSAEGLNDMVYNRCVGTRYCSNNCPYKVRHFNFLAYQDLETPSLMLARNPYVTVRTRGVMEKCTYCVQRLNAGRITSKKFIAQAATPAAPEVVSSLLEQAKQAILDIQTACQQSCPTNAIVFGDLNIKVKENPVIALKDEPGDYSLLEDLNTRPRTTYLPRITNPGT